MKVLIAEDERIARSLLERWLTEWGYDVVVVGDGQDALDTLRADREIQVAVLDWVMPRLDGVEVCRAIRASAPEPYVFLVLLSARDDEGHVVTGFDAGADDYIIKPYNPLELKLRLRVGRRIIDLQQQLVRAREAMRYEATHDALTGLLNRGALNSLLARELLRSERNDAPVSVVLIDLDHFKSINDRFGHAAGDAVLSEAARRLGEATRVYDTIGRLGGEEFLVLLPDCDSRTATIVAERLRRLVTRDPFIIDGRTLEVTLSAGVAGSDQRRRPSVEELLGASDAALYRAKHRGRNRVMLAADADWRDGVQASSFAGTDRHPSPARTPKDDAGRG